MQKQITNNDSFDNGTVIDEQYRPELLENLKEKKLLNEIIEEEMIAEGFNPLNRDDIKSYWMSKGITI